MRVCLSALLAMLLLAGCAPVAREPDDLALVRVLGIDGGGSVCLTARCGEDAAQSGAQGQAQADSFEQARRAVVWSGAGKELSLTGVSFLLVGTDADLEQLLYAVLEDEELGASATVWAVRESAAWTLTACGDPTADLELFTLRGIDAPTAAQALAALTTWGHVALPCVAAHEGHLEIRGSVDWKNGG